MKVTYNWLKDFVNIKIPPQALAEKLTMAGLEVVALEKTGEDFVLEIEITSNRPDWLSVLGIAREVAAITGKKINLGARCKVFDVRGKPKNLEPSTKNLITIEDKKDCPLYTARIIENVKVGPSPEWLKRRLESLGCRSVNNIVDITNYCLFELGQPLHAFDLDKLSQKEIRVRRANADEKIITIDGQTKILSPEILVIADTHKAVAIAGIMGGKETEVTVKTRNILLEGAVFNPLLVRRAKQKLGLQSESAYRFERGVDLEAVRSASWAAGELILKLASGKPSGFSSLGVSKVIHPVINLDAAYLNKVLGTAIPVFKIKQILNRLGLRVKTKTKNILTVGAPSFRQDLKLPVDLVEEVARIYGYGKIPQTLPAVKPGQEVSDKRGFICGIKNILSGLGLFEVITYSLVDRGLLKKSGLNIDAGLIEILNPLSKEQEVLRPALFPSLIRALAYNLDQQQERVSIFEIANIFSGQANAVAQEPLLGLALCGVNTFFTKQGLVRDEIILLHLKGILETLFNRLGVENFDFWRQEDNKIDIVINQKQAGFMLDLSPQILGAFDIKNRQVVLAQVNLEKLFSSINLGKKFLAIPKYPAITRDISLVINEDISVQEVLGAIEAKGAPLLVQAKIVDYYQGPQIPAGFKGLTISCIYRMDSRTLTEEEIAPARNDICSLLKERFGIELRK
ncbi:MAG: phenylalanine--tRNA ligase subunit beta [Candidatus Omnitrophica bacterium]|nr:phenylalanine--tRNA ligase subunit beta [Candidatus Omnitrophota bacterium]